MVRSHPIFAVITDTLRAAFAPAVGAIFAGAAPGEGGDQGRVVSAADAAWASAAMGDDPNFEVGNNMLLVRAGGSAARFCWPARNRHHADTA